MKQIIVFAFSCDFYLNISTELCMGESQEWIPVLTNCASLHWEASYKLPWWWTPAHEPKPHGLEQKAAVWAYLSVYPPNKHPSSPGEPLCCHGSPPNTVGMYLGALYFLCLPNDLRNPGGRHRMLVSTTAALKPLILLRSGKTAEEESWSDITTVCKEHAIITL